MSHSESYGYLIIRITGSFLDRCLGTLDCSRALLTRNSRGPSRTVLDFGLKGRIPTFCLVLWLFPLLSIGPSRTGDSVRDTNRMGNRPFNEWYPEWSTSAKRSGANEETMMYAFRKAIPAALHQKLMTLTPPPDTLNGLVEKAGEFDRVWRLFSHPAFTG